MRSAFSQENPDICPCEKGNLRGRVVRLEIMTEFNEKFGNLVFTKPKIFMQAK
jgi:hypothetical protein